MENKETGYLMREYKVPVRRYCRTLDLKMTRNLSKNTANAMPKKISGPKSLRE